MPSQISIHALLAESDHNRRINLLRFQNFYPRSPCGERQSASYNAHMAENISIHALLAESDHDTYVIMEATKIISIHALLAESDYRSYNLCSYDPRFLSTLSLRRATICVCGRQQGRRNFYPRSPCGERLLGVRMPKMVRLFLSTLSLRRATTSLVVIGTNCVISIHALLAESDSKSAQNSGALLRI